MNCAFIHRCTPRLNQISGALTSAPEQVRAKYRGMDSEAWVKAMTLSRPAGNPADPVVATQVTLKRLAMRHRFLSEEIAETDADLAYIVSTHAPELLEVNGVGAVVASQLLVTFGDNPERMTGEAAFAALAGVAPVPASSGKTNRHRLSRGGDRQANSALYRIVLVRMSKDKRTRDYVAKRTQGGLNKKEIIRCLKRYVAEGNIPGHEQPTAGTSDQRPAPTTPGPGTDPGNGGHRFVDLADLHFQDRARQMQRPTSHRRVPGLASKTARQNQLTSIGASSRVNRSDAICVIQPVPDPKNIEM